MLNSIAINVAEKQTSKKTLTTKNKIKNKKQAIPPKKQPSKKKKPKTPKTNKQKKPQHPNPS